MIFKQYLVLDSHCNWT